MAEQNAENLNTDFCLRLTSQVLEAKISQGKNFVASPLSLHAMLSLAASGSRGKTQKQILGFLGSESIGDLSSSSSQIVSLASTGQKGRNNNGGPVLSFLNGAWVDKRYDLRPSFKAIVKNTHRAVIRNVDFLLKRKEAVDEVNSWAEESTKGLIQDIVSYEAVDDETVLIFANALYFKGTWDRTFDVSRTRAGDFHLLNGNVVQAPFMTTHFSVRFHSYACFADYMVLRCPYRRGRDHQRRFSMYFLLPNKKDGLLSLIQKVESNPTMLNGKFRLEEEKLEKFWIPKFKFSFAFEASSFMKKMGLKRLFKPGKLTEMVDCDAISRKLLLPSIFHKACIEVNEEGTEAAACTAKIAKTCGRRRYPSFVADRPFLFMIREETRNVVFFVGAVLNPLLDS